MDIFFRAGDISHKPDCGLELGVVADGHAVRVELDRSAIQHYLGPEHCDEEAVLEFVRRNRKPIEWVIHAHLIAHGVPLNRHLVITANDLRGVQLV